MTSDPCRAWSCGGNVKFGYFLNFLKFFCLFVFWITYLRLLTTVDLFHYLHTDFTPTQHSEVNDPLQSTTHCNFTENKV